MPTEIHWELLSPTGKAIARRIVWPLAAGYTVSQVATNIGITRSSVKQLVDSLARELHQLSR